MQRIRLITMYSAFLIVLLHSIVPHTHRSEYSFEEHQTVHEEATGLFDFLSLAFHFDYGEGQLEEFIAESADSNSVDLDIESDQLILPGQPLFVALIPEYSKEFTLIKTSAVTIPVQASGLRGPPSLS